ncbi:MAG: MerC domain-containing protein [Gammaproteobacteria bacterium]|nr:MAG: MerC domain-containing protein [Gammaproteobacteria bacterium]
MDNSSASQSDMLDKVAVALSGLCLLHCLLMPVIITALPFFGQFSARHLHAEILTIVLPISLIALSIGFRRHADKRVVGWGIAGLLLLIVGATLAHNMYGVVADRMLAITGSVILAAAHYRNSRLSRSCRVATSSEYM